MGSDRAPAPEVAGAVRAARARNDLYITLVGDAPRLDALLGRELRDRIDIVHATEVVTMHDHPGQAFRQKPDSSMRVAVDHVAGGTGDAVVSAGNSGAMLNMGWLYQNGWGASQDYARAREWYEKAAATRWPARWAVPTTAKD